MRAYELMLLLNPELEEEAVEALIEKTTEIIKVRNGEIENIDQWGKRKLAYEVQDHTEGFYVVIRFKADNEDNRVSEDYRGTCFRCCREKE